MILSDQTIKEKILNKEIIIQSDEDINEIIKNIACASLDVRLGNYFKKFPLNNPENKVLNLDNIQLEEIFIKDGDYLILQPGEFVLGATKERFGIPQNIVARVEGRSSIGRLGILIHVTAGFIDPGFGLNSPSTITLEIKNINTIPVALKVGSRVCQIAFELMDKPAQIPYNKKPSAKYNGQIKPQESKISQDPKLNT